MLEIRIGYTELHEAPFAVQTGGYVVLGAGDDLDAVGHIGRSAMPSTSPLSRAAILRRASLAASERSLRQGSPTSLKRWGSPFLAPHPAKPSQFVAGARGALNL